MSYKPHQKPLPVVGMPADHRAILDKLIEDIRECDRRYGVKFWWKYVPPPLLAKVA